MIMAVFYGFLATWISVSLWPIIKYCNKRTKFWKSGGMPTDTHWNAACWADLVITCHEQIKHAFWQVRSYLIFKDLDMIKTFDWQVWSKHISRHLWLSIKWDVPHCFYRPLSKQKILPHTHTGNSIIRFKFWFLESSGFHNRSRTWYGLGWEFVCFFTSMTDVTWIKKKKTNSIVKPHGWVFLYWEVFVLHQQDDWILQADLVKMELDWFQVFIIIF